MGSCEFTLGVHHFDVGIIRGKTLLLGENAMVEMRPGQCCLLLKSR
jgi:hypothetical protein